MRLLKGIVLSLLLTVIGSSTVFADGTVEYKMDEIGVKIQVPENLLAYSRTSGIEQSVINALGYTSDDYQEHLIGKMKEENNYFIAFDANVDYQVSLKSVETKLGAFSTKSEEEIINVVNDGLDGELTQYGVEVTSSSVFTEKNRNYAVVNLKDSTGFCELYAIVENNQAYYFYIRSYAKEIGDAHRALIKQIAGSAEFYKKVEPSETQASTTTGSKPSKDKSKEATNMIGIIIDIAKIVLIIVALGLIIVGIIDKISKLKSNSKRSSARKPKKGKKGSGGAGYSIRRDVVYEERLNRIMGMTEKPEIKEAPLPEADEDEYSEDLNI